jgi:CDP-2,3-bis-(O-geranylgeranyl)-sn-glycerol synthase
MGWGWKLGALVAACSMGGDLFASFCKRRIGLTAGSRATGLDQVPEALFPALAVRGMLSLSWLDVAVVVLVFLVGEMVLSVLFFRWHLRDRPY